MLRMPWSVQFTSRMYLAIGLLRLLAWSRRYTKSALAARSSATTELRGGGRRRQAVCLLG